MVTGRVEQRRGDRSLVLVKKNKPKEKGTKYKEVRKERDTNVQNC